MKIVKNIVFFILGLFLVFNIVFVTLGLFVHFKLYNYNYYISKFNSCDYYHAISMKSITKLSSLSSTTNIPKEAFKAYSDETWIKSQVNNYTKHLIQYVTFKKESPYNIDFRMPGLKFDKSMNKYLESNNMLLDKNISDEISTVKRESEEVIDDSINIFDLKGIVAYEDFQVVRKSLGFIYSNIFVYCSGLGLLLILILIYYRKVFYNILLWYGYSFVAAGALIFFFSFTPYFINFSRIMSLMEDEHIRVLITSIIDGFDKYFIEAGVIIVVLGLSLIWISSKKTINYNLKIG
ncbi:MAG: hypothetical protein H7Y18_01850 [Clostridiaceae bacterium]|nr:hypothetical protein [Clostridiaceae bacterium]